MKKAIVFALMLVSFTSNAQMNPKAGLPKSDTLKIMDSNGRLAAYRVNKDSSNFVVINPVGAVNTLVTLIANLSTKQNEIVSVYEKAAAVLSCIDVNGEVKDRVKLKKAIIEYLQALK